MHYCFPVSISTGLSECWWLGDFWCPQLTDLRDTCMTQSLRERRFVFATKLGLPSWSPPVPAVASACVTNAASADVYLHVNRDWDGVEEGNKRNDKSKTLPSPQPLLWLFLFLQAAKSDILGHNNRQKLQRWRDWWFYAVYIRTSSVSGEKSPRLKNVIVRPRFIILAGSCIKSASGVSFPPFLVSTESAQLCICPLTGLAPFLPGPFYKTTQNVFKL